MVEMDVYHFSAEQGGVVIQAESNAQVGVYGSCFIGSVKNHYGVAAASALACVFVLIVVGFRLRQTVSFSSR